MLKSLGTGISFRFVQTVDLVLNSRFFVFHPSLELRLRLLFG